MCNDTQSTLARLRRAHECITDRDMVINALTKKSPSVSGPLFDVLANVGLVEMQGNQHNQAFSWNFEKLKIMQLENLVDLYRRVIGELDPSKIRG
jgi:glutathione peroxidase-family protein